MAAKSAPFTPEETEVVVEWVRVSESEVVGGWYTRVLLRSSLESEGLVEGVLDLKLWSVWRE